MGNELVTQNQNDFSLLAGEELRDGLSKIREFQNIVKELLVKGLDYGVVPGCGDKPTLLKPGAEKLAKLHKLADTYEVVEKTEDWDIKLFRYIIKCRLVLMGTDMVVSEGMGECNSYESKYKYRWVYENKVPAHLDKVSLKSKSYINDKGKAIVQYQIDNDDIYSQINTILKMAKKRAMVDAVLSATRLSAVFTQDIEDIKESINPDTEHPAIAKPETNGSDTEKKDSDEKSKFDVICEICKKQVKDKKVIEYSLSKYGKIACYNCQKECKPIK